MEKWPEGAIETLVRVAREAEEAAAVDGRCLPWVRERLAKADTARRNGLRDLCLPRSTNAVREAAVASIEAAGEDYKAVRAAAGALASAFREYEETRAVLVDLAVAYPYDALAGGEVLATTWDALADDFGKVQQLLRPTTSPALPNVGNWDAQCKACVPGVNNCEPHCSTGRRQRPTVRESASLAALVALGRTQLLTRSTRRDRAARGVLDAGRGSNRITERLARRPARE